MVRFLAFFLLLSVHLFNFCSQQAIKTENECNFLFKHYDINPIAKTLPRDVQALICRELLDLIIGEFQIDSPFLTINEPKEHKRSNINTPCGAFSRDGKKFAYCTNPRNTRTTCKIVDLTQKEPAPEFLFSVDHVHDEPPNEKLPYDESITFSPDGSRIALMNREGVFEFDINNRKIVISEKLDNPKRFFKDAEGANLEVKALGYTDNGELCGIVNQSQSRRIPGILITFQPRCGELKFKSHFLLKYRGRFCADYAWCNKDCSKFLLMLVDASKACFCATDNAECGPLFNLLPEDFFTCWNDCLKNSFQNGNFIILPLRKGSVADGFKNFVTIFDCSNRCTVAIFELTDGREPICLAIDVASHIALIGSDLNVLEPVEKRNFILELFDVASKKRIAYAQQPPLAARAERKAYINGNGPIFAIITMVSPEDSSIVEFYKMPAGLPNILEVLKGKLTLEQCLLCLYLRELHIQGLQLKDNFSSISRSQNLDVTILKHYFKKVFNSCPPSLRRYIFSIVKNFAHLK